MKYMIERSESYYIYSNRHGHVLGLDTARLKHMGHVSRVHDVSRQQLGKQRPVMTIEELFDLSLTWFLTWRIVHSSKALVYDPLIRNDCVHIVPELFQVIIVIVTIHLPFECWPLMRSCQDQAKIDDTTHLITLRRLSPTSSASSPPTQGHITGLVLRA